MLGCMAPMARAETAGQRNGKDRGDWRMTHMRNIADSRSRRIAVSKRIMVEIIARCGYGGTNQERATGGIMVVGRRAGTLPGTWVTGRLQVDARRRSHFWQDRDLWGVGGKAQSIWGVSTIFAFGHRHAATTPSQDSPARPARSARQKPCQLESQRGRHGHKALPCPFFGFWF
jgi:hypothetical protein